MAPNKPQLFRVISKYEQALIQVSNNRDIHILLYHRLYLQNLFIMLFLNKDAIFIHKILAQTCSTEIIEN